MLTPQHGGVFGFQVGCTTPPPPPPPTPPYNAS
jgi:hypothetical protein